MNKIKVSDYIVEQLQKIGIKDFFGLPGDYNFKLLDSVENNENTNWIGCTNELNAGYAADGYARIKGYGALITTYGVGELSAINAIAGSCAENVPVFKIVGVPNTKAVENNILLHHNLNTPDYYAFQRAYANVVETTAFLDKTNAKDEIDRLISVFIKEKRPVYLAVPADICDLEIKDEPNIETPQSNSENLKKAVEHAIKLINSSDFPCFLVDVLAKRFDALESTKKLLTHTQLPVTTLLMGKSLIQEDSNMFLGTYLGSYDNLYAYKYINNSDCVISIGTIFSDLNTFGFDIRFAPSKYINIQGTYTVVENKKYENVLMKDVLDELTKTMKTYDVKIPKEELGYEKPQTENNGQLKSDYIYPRLQEFLRPDDIIFSETGIVKFGVAGMKLPVDTSLNNQVLWGSIGWATPAAFGAAMADKSRRVILLTGEGSHQLTAQEISSMMRYGVKPIVIVLNNSGYTIERILSDDPMDKFNDIAVWDYSKLPSVFKGNVWTAQAETNEEFNNVLNQAEIEQQNRMCYIEIFTEMLDVPLLTKRVVKKLRDKEPKMEFQVK